MTYYCQNPCGRKVWLLSQLYMQMVAYNMQSLALLKSLRPRDNIPPAPCQNERHLVYDLDHPVEALLGRSVYFAVKSADLLVILGLRGPVESIVSDLKQSRFPTSFLPKKLLFKNRSICELSNRSDFEI